MSKAVIAAALFFIAANVFAACEPHFVMTGVSGDYACDKQSGAIDFVLANVGHNRLMIVKRVDKASPSLYAATAEGKRFRSLVLVVPSQKQKYTFTDVFVTSCVQSATAANAMLASETLTLSFALLQSSTKVHVKNLRIAGSASPPSVRVTFLGEPATGWQAAVQMTSSGRARITAFVQTSAKPHGGVALARSAGAPVHGCTELRRADGTVLARYVFDAIVPAAGGTLDVQKIQVQVPPEPACGWSTKNPTAV